MSQMKYGMLLLGIILALFSIVLGQGMQGKTQITFSAVVPCYIETISRPIDWSQTNSINFAYANCPFSATLAGENPGNNPVVARITFSFNGREYDFVDWTSGATQFPVSRSYSETPHNGQVKLNIYVKPDSVTGSSPKLIMTLTPL